MVPWFRWLVCKNNVLAQAIVGSNHAGGRLYNSVYFLNMVLFLSVLESINCIA